MGTKKTVNGMLIGEYAQKAIKALFIQNKISEIEINKLLNDDYCKIRFDLNYPMLKKFMNLEISTDMIDIIKMKSLRVTG